MKTLYITDLDGTLLNKEARISDISCTIINGLIKKGIPFSFASARSINSASVVIKGLDFELPVVTYNGVSIVNPKTREVLYHASFTEEERELVTSVIKKSTVSPAVYSYIDGEEKLSWIPTLENEGMTHYISKRAGDNRLRPLSSEEGLYDGEVFYYTCIGTKEELQPIYEIFSKDGRFRCTLQQEIYREEYWCEIMPAKATKANAILKLKEMLGFEKVVCFGDAINDIPMFEIADEAYAVENAVNELKSVATGVIPSNEEDGVARWLQENIKK